MSGEEGETLPSNWVEQELAALRQQFINDGRWSDAAEALLARLFSVFRASVEGDDYDMLSFVLTDALEGVDIAERYPAFFTRLWADPALSQAFVEAIEVLEETGEELDQDILLSHDLRFLQNSKIGPQIETPQPGHWRLAWQLLTDQLNQLFFQAPSLVYRKGDTSLEDESFILIDDEVRVAELTLNVILEAIRPVSEPGWLRLQLLAAADTEPPPLLEATLHWGHYTATVSPDAYGQAYFPPLPLHTILDESERQIAPDLQLVIEGSSISAA